MNRGGGPSLDLRIKKLEEGIPFTPVPEGTLGAAVVAIKRVNELDYYNLNLTALAEKTKITTNKLGAVIKELKIQENKDAFKEIKINSQTYSPLALDILKKEVPNLYIEQIWQKTDHNTKQINENRFVAFEG